MCSIQINSAQFWKAITIWLKNSHVVNRRLCGVTNIGIWKIENYSLNIDTVLSECLKFDFNSLNTNHKIILNIFNSQDDTRVTEKCFREFDEEIMSLVEHLNEEKIYFILMQKLLPRSSKYRDTYQISLVNLNEDCTIFINISDESDKISIAPNYPYEIKLKLNKITLKTEIIDEKNEGSLKWLNEQLIPRIEKWSLSDTTNPNGIINGSLKLVSLNEYNDLYQELKDKYGQHIVKIWPEVTDPSKFVYEDVAIATYLLLLWRNERKNTLCDKMQSFLDLGCGNGLLVYILSSEGHPGKGIDIRKRGIWDIYPSFVKLEEKSVEPTESCLYKDVDWLIGNHSDELTPWIPVISTRSSYNCKFFLLPCCAFNFDGTKYQRKNSSKSQYNEYLEYVQTICEKCGIYTQIDRLKIPSTKRICLIGTRREYSILEHEEHLVQLKHFVENSNKKNENITNDSWMNDFKPREAVEQVRNCTKIDKNVINEIVEIVTSKLLSNKRYIKNWNAGGCVPISDIPKYITEEKLKYLKKECGGLQTLLKNNHHIFEVDCGTVKFRYPKSKNEYTSYLSTKKNKNGANKKNIEYKVKPCWFYINHPDGCPLDSEECRFSHIQ